MAAQLSEDCGWRLIRLMRKLPVSFAPFDRLRAQKHRLGVQETDVTSRVSVTQCVPAAR
jgi:hypothetical protein